jgi:exopolyphosphatase/guanosine-5'-triphosphate,3'-diphosphate pyrophosphatase
MAVLLRIAESLDRSHKEAIPEARFKSGKKGKLVLEVRCDQDCELELWGVERHREMFKDVFAKELVIKSVSGGDRDSNG